MKELSIEEKAKAYDVAIEKLRGLLECIHEDNCEIMEEDITNIFPELKESELEDEKIREQVVYAINQLHVCECTKKKLLAWLEKQGEQKPNNNQFTPEQADILDEYIDNFRGQKSAWSEEDDKMLNDAIGAVGASDYYTYDNKQEIENFLTSLKDRMKTQWKPSDEQMKQLKSAADIYPDSRLGYSLNTLYKDLEKLR